MIPDEPRSDALQSGLSAPLPRPPLELPALAPVPRSPLWTKLYFLRQAQQLAVRSAQRASNLHAFGILLGLAIGLVIGFVASVSVYFLVYDDPHKYVDTKPTFSGDTIYYVRGKEVTEHEYDHFLRSQDNSTTATTLAFLTGLLLILGIIAVFWLLFRPRESMMAQKVEDQIGTIVRDHADAVASWGGEWVLRVPKLVDKLLDMEAGESPE